MVEDLFTIRAKARNTDPRTSLEAADSISSDRLRESQKIVWDCLNHYGQMTDEQLYRVLPKGKFSLSGARSRRHELVERGLVIDTGLKAKTASGRNTIIWRAV